MSQLASNPLFLQAVAHHRSRRFRDAIAGYERLLKVAPRNPQVLSMLGSAQNSVGMIAEGRRNLEKAIELAPNVAQFHHGLSLTYRREGNFAKSRRILDKAIELAPGDASFKAGRAELQYMEGDFRGAAESLDPLLGLDPPNAAVAACFGMVALRVKRERDAIALITRTLARPEVIPAQRMKLLFTLGALHDALDEHDLAFDAYRRGNELQPDRFDDTQHQQRVTAAIAAWTPAFLERMPAAKVDASKVVFIVGMPRSGTTLVEQILEASPTVHAAGELGTMLDLARTSDPRSPGGMPMAVNAGLLTPEVVQRSGATYLAAIRALHVGNRTVLDKMPMNFLNLGLIQLALPGAKVIHCVRDAQDTCLSCYFQLFDGNLGFAYDLASAGRFHREYERLMAHWKQVLTLPILDVRYEDLVADQEAQSRRLYDFVGVPWTDGALRFHESARSALTSSNAQVRQPLYNRSVLRHRHYERHLAPLREALAGRR